MATENNQNEELFESILCNQLELKAKFDTLLDHLEHRGLIDRQVFEMDAHGLTQEYELRLHDPILFEFEGIIEE